MHNEQLLRYSTKELLQSNSQRQASCCVSSISWAKGGLQKLGFWTHATRQPSTVFRTLAKKFGKFLARTKWYKRAIPGWHNDAWIVWVCSCKLAQYALERVSVNLPGRNTLKIKFAELHTRTYKTSFFILLEKCKGNCFVAINGFIISEPLSVVYKHSHKELEFLGRVQHCQIY